MGRSKPHKPPKARRAREPLRQWYGTAYHSQQGMRHLDVRCVGNSMLITMSPADTPQGPQSWQLRLRNDDHGQGLRDLGTAWQAGRAHGLGDPDGAALAFLPDHPAHDVGTFASVRITGPGADDVIFQRWAELPMTLWAVAGEHLLQIIPSLDADASHASWEPEDCQPCPGCARPVYDSMDSAVLLGGPGIPITGLCSLCVRGETLHGLRQTGVDVPPHQRAVLESAAAVLA